MAQAIAARKDPQPEEQQAPPARKDPQPRSLRQYAIGGTVRDARPDRRYMYANPVDQTMGLDFMLDTGWHKVNAKSDKERAQLGRVEPDGETVTYRGQVLIWIDAEEFEARDIDRASFAIRHEKAKKQPGGPDGVRGADKRLATEWRPEEPQ